MTFEELLRRLAAVEESLRRANQQCAELRGENELLRALLDQYRPAPVAAIASEGASA